MLTVNELATQSGAPAHVVRYYVRIGLLQPVTTQDNGYRLFAAADASRLRFVRMENSDRVFLYPLCFARGVYGCKPVNPGNKRPTPKVCYCM